MSLVTSKHRVAGIITICLNFLIVDLYTHNESFYEQSKKHSIKYEMFIERIKFVVRMYMLTFTIKALIFI